MKSSNNKSEVTGKGVIKKMIVATALIFAMGSTFAAGHYRGYAEHPVRYDYRFHEAPRYAHPVVYRYHEPVCRPVYQPYYR